MTITARWSPCRDEVIESRNLNYDLVTVEVP